MRARRSSRSATRERVVAAGRELAREFGRESGGVKCASSGNAPSVISVRPSPWMKVAGRRKDVDIV
jgi:hypothetical protein